MERASFPSEGLVAPDKPPRLPVPGANVTVEITISLSESRVIDHGPAVMVRCGEPCGHRLFDLRAYPDGCRSVVIVRKCPKCGRRNEGRITRVSGDPLIAADALEGSWRCECGYYLGRVDAVRGRIKVPCRRCENRASVNVAEAIAVTYRAT